MAIIIIIIHMKTGIMTEPITEIVLITMKKNRGEVLDGITIMFGLIHTMIGMAGIIITKIIIIDIIVTGTIEAAITKALIIREGTINKNIERPFPQNRPERQDLIFNRPTVIAATDLIPIPGNNFTFKQRESCG
jgi:vacuolar-type H+-ATPase subunit I/STV1